MVLNTATHGADQMMVQRYLSARSQRQAAGALVASGLVILAQFALFLFIGVALFVFYQAYPPEGSQAVARRCVRLVHRSLPADGRHRPGHRGDLLGRDGDALGLAQRLGLDDGQRPLPADHRLHRRAATAAHLADAHGRLGRVQMAVALGATRLKDSVVNNALAIASFATGILLGLFLLGILTRAWASRPRSSA